MSKSFKFLIISFFALLVFSCGIVLLSHDFSIHNPTTEEQQPIEESDATVGSMSTTCELINVGRVSNTVTITITNTSDESHMNQKKTRASKRNLGNASDSDGSSSLSQTFTYSTSQNMYFGAWMRTGTLGWKTVKCRLDFDFSTTGYYGMSITTPDGTGYWQYSNGNNCSFYIGRNSYQFNNGYTQTGGWGYDSIDSVTYDLYFFQYTRLTFDLNGGNINGSTSNWSGYAQYGNYSVYSDYALNASEVSITNPTKTGYDFAGWTTNRNSGDIVFDTSGALCNASGYVDVFGKWAYSEATKTLYAKWTPKKYSITFNENKPDNMTSSITQTLNGSPYTTPSQSVSSFTTYNSAVSKTAYATATCWEFDGYYTEGGTQLFDASGNIVKGVSGYTDSNGKWINDGGVTLYAHWTANKYGVTLDENKPLNMTSSVTQTLNNSAYNTTTNNKLTYDSVPSITKAEATGWTFNGYYTASSGGSQIFDASGNPVASVSGYTNANKKWTRTSAATLYAQWTAKSYTITFNPNKPSNMTSSIDEYLNGTKYTNTTQAVLNFVTYDNVISKTAKASANGWTFNGFYTASDGGLQVFDASGNPVASVSGYTNADKKWRKPSTVTFYAHWTANKYGVTLDENKPLNMTSSVTQTLNNSAYNTTTNNKLTYDSVPSTTKASATGWTFNGYYTASSGGSQIFDASGNPVASVSGYTNANGKWTRTSDAELYAQWTAKILTITLSNNSATITGTSTIYLKYDDGYYLDSVASSNKKITNSTNSIAIPTKNGVVFDGYYTSGGTKYIDEYGFYKFTSQSDEDKAARSYFSANGTLHAHYTETWAKDSYILAPTLSGGYYQIASEANLAWLMVNVNSGENIWKDSNNNDISGAKQTKNLNLTNHKWFPIGTSTQKFAKIYNGQGYQISGLETHADVAGLFGYVTGRVINVYLSNSTISGKTKVGAIAGDLTGGTVANCMVYNTKVNGGAGSYAGGIVGNSTVAMSNCAFVYLKDTSNSITGGTKGLIVGYNTSTTTDCVAATASTTGMNINGKNTDVTDCMKKLGTSAAEQNSTGTFSNWKTVSNMFVSKLPKGLFWIANW